MEEIHYISDNVSDNAKMKNVTENRSLKAENTDFCNSEIHDPKDTGKYKRKQGEQRNDNNHSKRNRNDVWTL